MSEPRSVRLNAAHRTDITTAVMAEWEKQNPRPEQTSHMALLIAVAEEFKKHPTYKRTVRALELLEPDDLHHVRKESSVNVVIRDPKTEEDKRIISVSFPRSFTKKHKLQHLPYTHRKRTELAKHECDTGDDWELNANYSYDFVNCVTFMEADTPMVILYDDHPALVQAEELRKAIHAWTTERDKLRSETADLLNQYSSTKQLRDLWPEIVPYLPPHIADPERAVTLPVLATSRLSERLGIK